MIHNDLVFKEVACKVVLAATRKYLCTSALISGWPSSVFRAFLVFLFPLNLLLPTCTLFNARVLHVIGTCACEFGVSGTSYIEDMH